MLVSKEIKTKTTEKDDKWGMIDVIMLLMSNKHADFIEQRLGLGKMEIQWVTANVFREL